MRYPRGPAVADWKHHFEGSVLRRRRLPFPHCPRKQRFRDERNRDTKETTLRAVRCYAKVAWAIVLTALPRLGLGPYTNARLRLLGFTNGQSQTRKPSELPNKAWCAVEAFRHFWRAKPATLWLACSINPDDGTARTDGGPPTIARKKLGSILKLTGIAEGRKKIDF